MVLCFGDGDEAEGGDAEDGLHDGEETGEGCRERMVGDVNAVCTCERGLWVVEDWSLSHDAGSGGSALIARKGSMARAVVRRVCLEQAPCFETVEDLQRRRMAVLAEAGFLGETV